MLSFFKKKPDRPDWVLAYEQSNFRPGARLKLYDLEYCVLDCETTGLHKEASVVSIGGVLATGRDIRMQDCLDIKWPTHEGNESTEIHEELPTNPQDFDVESALCKMLTFIADRPIVGHNIAFDIQKLNQLFGQFYHGFKLRNKVLDTSKLMIRLDAEKYERSVGGFHGLQLDVVCADFKIPVENRHTALGDAFMTALVFQRIVDRLDQRGIGSWMDL